MNNKFDARTPGRPASTQSYESNIKQIGSFASEDIISIWNKTASDQATITRIRDTLRRVLNLPPNTIMEYKTHTDSIKAWEDFHGLVNAVGGR
ncbi:unnamed protein product [Coregonus sp. 'balchen']|nr:unnamed protein product [Coregonus sp. 'balchen']